MKIMVIIVVKTPVKMFNSLYDYIFMLPGNFSMVVEEHFYAYYQNDKVFMGMDP